MQHVPPAIDPVPVVVTRQELLLDSIGNASFILIEIVRTAPWWVLLLVAVMLVLNAGRVLGWVFRRVAFSTARDLW